MEKLSQLPQTAQSFLAAHVLQPLYRLQRLLVPERRSQMQAYHAGLLFRREAQAWSSPAALRVDARTAAAHGAARGAAPRPFTGNGSIEAGFNPESDFDFDDYARLPVLEREEIHEAGRALVSTAVPPEQLRKDATGGSTGTPTEIWLGPEERGWRESASAYFMPRIGVRPGARRGLLWGHHLDPVASDRWRDRLRSLAANQEWFDCFRLSPDVLERYHQRLQQTRPVCVIAYASALASLAEHVAGDREPPRYPRQCFVTGAEKLLPQGRETIERVFGRPVHERYGSRDVGLIGFQLDPARSLDFTIDWANVWVEPETETEDAPILITKLHADGMPMLRYRIGDLGRFAKEDKPGHPAFVLREVLGRELDRLWLPDGRWVHGVGIPHLMKDFPLSEFQIVQEVDFSVVVYLVPQDGFERSMQEQIIATLQPNLPDLPISARVVDRVERTRANKWRPVVSKANPNETISTR